MRSQPRQQPHQTHASRMPGCWAPSPEHVVTKPHSDTKEELRRRRQRSSSRGAMRHQEANGDDASPREEQEADTRRRDGAAGVGFLILN